MDFRLTEALPVLRRTPAALRALLLDASELWSRGTEGPDTWSPFDVVGHLIHADRTNWVPRVEHMLLRRDGAAFMAEVVVHLFVDVKGGRLLDAESVWQVRDITAERELRREIRELM